MSIEFACSHCSNGLRVADNKAGKRVLCPKCKSQISVPGDAWYLKTEEGEDFGPINRREMETWLAEGRLTSECQLLRQGSEQWQWATDVFPQLATPQGSAADSTPLPRPILFADEAPEYPHIDSSQSTGRPASVHSRFRQSVRQRFRPSTSWLDLFDWKFEKYLTPWIVRATWVVCVALAALWLSLIVFATVWAMVPDIESNSSERPNVPFEGPEFRAPTLPRWLTARVASVLGGITLACSVILGVLWLRVLLETVIVLFNIATTLTSIDQKIQQSEESS